MVYSPQWTNDKIGIRTTRYDGCFPSYLIYSQKLAKKTFNLYLSFWVAS